MTNEEMYDFVFNWLCDFEEEKLDDIGLIDQSDFRLYQCMKKLQMNLEYEFLMNLEK